MRNIPRSHGLHSLSNVSRLLCGSCLLQVNAHLKRLEICVYVLLYVVAMLITCALSVVLYHQPFHLQESKMEGKFHSS